MVQDMRLIELKGVCKSFGDTQVLHDVDLYIRKCEFITLLGPSGCGKTTLLRIIGGFDMPSSGEVLFEGRDMTDIPPYKRRINTVFQKYALFNHLNVYDNIAFGLNLKTPEQLGVKTKKEKKAEIERRVQRMLKLVKMEGYEKRSTDALSGGQQQRIAIARALVNEPEVLLLDEPLGALDLKLRKEMQLELKAMQQQLGITFIYVTHDQEEALTMSDTIAVMNGGRVQQIGDPKRIYDEPKNAFVADFIGESNILDGVMLEDDLVKFCGTEFQCVDEGFGTNEPVDVVIRPEDIMIVGEDVGMLTGTVQSVIFKGVHYEMMIKGDQREAQDILWKVHSTTMQPVGTRVGMTIVPYNIHIMHKARTADAAPVQETEDKEA
ncbi:MAG: ABC transporter ATP-binding protein [Clostridia bacterium]|nr:ABC transporter ATP-binding protein [Clostridia bacterium]